MFFAEGIKTQYDSFHVEEGINNLEHQDFAHDEHASFREIMPAAAKSLLNEGHKSYGKTARWPF